jgi:hypothetical protein
VDGIAVAHTVAVGAPRTAGGEPTVFIFGLPTNTTAGVDDDDLHVLGSVDRGATWVSLRDGHGKGLGNWPETIVASRAEFGMVAVGSFGRGALFTDASAVL